MSILLSVPTRGAIHHATVTRLEEIRDTHPGMAPILYQEGHLNVALTRNQITQHFCAGAWDVLAMIDDDVAPPHGFLTLVEHLTTYSMVGVPYLQSTAEGRVDYTIYEDHPEGGFMFAEPELGLNECDALAAGCIMIHRRVFDVLGDTPFRMSDDPRSPASDDLVFCQAMRHAGFTIGYWWDGTPADHYPASVTLAPLKERMMVHG